MSYSAQQITEKGKQPRYIKKAKNKLNKKFHHRRMRQKMKNIDFHQQYNRFDGGWQE
jgi:hypothetical protein